MGNLSHDAVIRKIRSHDPQQIAVSLQVECTNESYWVVCNHSPESEKVNWNDREGMPTAKEDLKPKITAQCSDNPEKAHSYSLSNCTEFFLSPCVGHSLITSQSIRTAKQVGIRFFRHDRMRNSEPGNEELLQKGHSSGRVYISSHDMNLFYYSIL